MGKSVLGSSFGYVSGGKYDLCYVGARPEKIKFIDFSPKYEMLTFWECHDNLQRYGKPLPKSCIADIPYSQIESYEKTEQNDSYIFTLNWKSGEKTSIRVEKANTFMNGIERSLAKAVKH